MAGCLKLIGYTLFLYLCAYGIIGRVYKCIEHHTEWKYRARVDTEWLNAQRMKQTGRSSDRKEGNQDVRRERNAM